MVVLDPELAAAKAASHPHPHPAPSSSASPPASAASYLNQSIYVQPLPQEVRGRNNEMSTFRCLS